LINQLISLVKFIAFLVLIGIKYQNKFVLINWPKRGKNQAFKHRLLHKIILFTARCIGARVYSFPGIQAPYTKAFLERTSAEGAKKISRFEKRLEGEGIISSPDRANKLVFTDEHKRYLHEMYGFEDNVHCIGIPRLFACWQNYRKKYGQIDYQRTLKEIGVASTNEKVITILVTNPDYPWFKRDHNFFSLLEEAILSIRSFFPNEVILLKAKSEIFDAIQNYEALRKHSKVYLYDRSLASLSDHSIFCLSIAESSGIFDFLTAGVPVIEYSDYCDEYLEVFPEVNPWIGTPGFFVSHNVDDLRGLIKKMAAKKVSYSSADLCKYYMHKKNLRVLSIS
jgi:hypothetical protein